ncbi:MAG: uroporphyrinogen decarboxylase family protein [Clostridia bacterium]|nr:uroporphyrinogen decarboxylase family protein [Clostridia bacterium]
MNSFEISRRKIQDYYDHKPGAPIFQKEFGFFTLDKWISQGFLKPTSEVADYPAYLAEIFGFDADSIYYIDRLGGCEAALEPAFEEKVLEDRGRYEVIQDNAGRHLLCFKGRRQGFMPEYVDHPVKDLKTWQDAIEWRMDAGTPSRREKDVQAASLAKQAQRNGMFITHRLVGGFMYLRSLIGPEALLYKFYDEPQLIHTCMRKWLDLAEAVSAGLQESVSFDGLFFDEDICYNHGPLISPDMISEFLIPYYQQLIQNIRRRQPEDKTLHIQIETDGFCEPVIDLYREIGTDEMSPFEVASGCDLTRVSEKYPDLLISGGIDKRVLCESFDSIDRYLDNLLPELVKRGGFIPTCDHGVPEEVEFENYMHFRKRMLQYAE